MRPFVVPAILLLVVLMFTSDSAAGDPAEMCKTKYPATPCINKSLGKGWFQMGDQRCVKAFFDPPNLDAIFAELTCAKFPNGHLVSIHSDDDLNQVQCAMYRANPNKAHYWIGAFYLMDRLVWVWADTTKFDYTRWAGGQPDNFKQIEHCIEMNYWDWGIWNDVFCYVKRPYVCAVKI